MTKIDYAKVKKQKNEWTSYFSRNDQRGEMAIQFAELGEQDTINIKSDSGYETLVFNILLKYLRHVQEEAANLDLSLLFYPLDDDSWDKKYKQQIKEYQAELMQAQSIGPSNPMLPTLQQRLQQTQQIYAQARQNRLDEQKNHQAILNTLMLDTNKKSAFEDAVRQVYSYGYSVLAVNAVPDIQDNKQFQKLEIECLKSPSDAFFDKNAKHKTKTNGRFCGYRYNVTRDELRDRYSKNKKIKVKLADWSENKKIEVIEYYYKDKKPNGDLGETVYYVRFIDDVAVDKPKPLNIGLLPLVYHSGLTVWNPARQEDVTLPFIVPMIGAAKLYNYLGTQIANLAKQTSGRKVIMDKQDIIDLTAGEAENWRNFNTRDGVLVRPNRKANNTEQIPPQIIDPMQIPQTLTETFAVIKQVIDEIAGAFLSMQGAEDNAISGSAIDARVRQSNIPQNGVIKVHENTIKIVGDVIKQWLPSVYHQEQTLIVQHKDNSLRRITINKKLMTGTIQNDLDAMRKKYSYELELIGSSKLDEENTREYLTQIYRLSPQAFELTADLYAQTLDIKDRDVLARRLRTMVDPLVIQFGDGDINFKELSSQRQQLQQQAEQSNPQTQYLQSEIQHKQAQTQTQQFEAQTKRQQLMSQIQQNNQQLSVAMDKLQHDKENNESKNIISLLHAQLEHNNQLLAALGVKS